MLKLTVSFCLLATLASSDADFQPEKSIVSVLKNQQPKCMGVVADQKFIITSAHCVFGSAPSSLSVKSFTQGLDNTTVFGVQKVLVHPYYTPPSLDYDIALLKIESLGATGVAVPLAKVEPLPKDEVKAIYLDEQNNEISPKLAPAKIEDRKSCKNKVGKFVSGRMICGYDENPTVKTDGPLIFGDALTGILSKRIESNQGVLPAIYTNIANSEIYSFIESFV